MSGDPLSKPDWWLHCVPEAEDGSRLDRYLRRLVPGLTQGPVEKMLRSGLIRLDGAKAKPATRLEAGQELRLPPHLRDAPVPAAPAKPKASPQLRRQFEAMRIAEGDDWIAINKPSGLAVQGGSGTNRHVDGMLQALAEGDEDRMRLVHRIDKDTSGVLLLARDRVAARHLTRAFQQQDMEKTYLALVAGAPPETLEMKGALLKRGGAGGEMMAVDPEGQPSHSSLRLIEPAGFRMALVALQPRTGRTHQLRVHMAHAGHPIVGDGKYGGAASHVGGVVAARLHLHAWRLRLPDGTNLQAPLPDHFRGSLATLGLAVPGAGWQFATTGK
ncbi:MAG: RluA family pseudouridine synthase [Pseudomonadota bacterium]|nr:RluA family pseudouridine synthase [Pseudomonadota bacterium]